MTGRIQKVLTMLINCAKDGPFRKENGKAELVLTFNSDKEVYAFMQLVMEIRYNVE